VANTFSLGPRVPSDIAGRPGTREGCRTHVSPPQVLVDDCPLSLKTIDPLNSFVAGCFFSFFIVFAFRRFFGQRVGHSLSGFSLHLFAPRPLALSCGPRHMLMHLFSHPLWLPHDVPREVWPVLFLSLPPRRGC